MPPFTISWSPADSKTSVVILVATLLLTTWKYFGTHQFYRRHLAPRFALRGDVEFTAAAYQFGAGMLLLGLVPAWIVTYVFGERLVDYGLVWGDVRLGLYAGLVLGPIMAALSWWSSKGAAFQAEYPLNRTAGRSVPRFLAHLVTFLGFYAAWEFFFRGFMLHGLIGLGVPAAILIQTLASCLVHIGAPARETYGSIFGGILWGLLRLLTGSIVWGMLQHFTLGATLDFCLSFRREPGAFVTDPARRPALGAAV